MPVVAGRLVLYKFKIKNNKTQNEKWMAENCFEAIA